MPEWQGAAGSYPLCDFPNPAGFQNRTARLAAGYQADLAVGTRHLLTAGAEVEHETGELGNRAGELLTPGAHEPRRLPAGPRAARRARLPDRRRPRSSGTAATARTPCRASPSRVRLREGEDATTLRASAGMGIKEPSFLESYGESFFAKGNPDLDPERSTTFDVGVEQRLLASRLRAAVTWFHHDYRDQIAYTVVDWTHLRGHAT